MKTQEKPPRKKSPGRSHEPGNLKKSRPAEAERGGKEGPDAQTAAGSADTPSREEVISNLTRPVTNQDEQDKITNAGEGDIPVANN